MWKAHLSALVVSATSSNQTIVPNANIGLGGSDANRTISVSPAQNQNGTVTITVTVTDGVTPTTRSFDVTIKPTNDPPSISPIDNRTVAEDTATGPIVFTVADPDSGTETITVTATSSDQSIVPDANITLGGTGQIRTIDILPAADRNGGPVTITVTVNDATQPATETFTVTVTPVNDAPRVINPIGTVVRAENAPDAVIDLTTVFRDVDVATTPGHQLSYVARYNSNLSLVDVQVSGSNLILDFEPNQNGEAQVIVRATDNGFPSLWVEDTFTVRVTDQNNPPTISAVADQTTAEDTPTPAIAFVIGDTETPVGQLTLTATSSNQTLVPDANIAIGGTGASRTVTVTPAANQAGGPITVTLTVNDGANTATETFQLTVTPVPDAPTISAIDDRTTNEDTAIPAIALTVDDADTPVGSLTVTAVSNDQTLIPNANLVLNGSGANRTLTVTPAANQHGGPATITVTVSDGAASKTETFQVTVTSVNDNPTITDITDQTTPESATIGPIAFTIGDDTTPVGSLTVTASSNNQGLVPNGGIVLAGSGANRTLTITPAASQSGSATITVTVQDSEGGTAADSFVLNVSLVGPPTISAIADQTTSEDTALAAISFTVGDAETPAGSLTVTGTSSNTALVPNANVVLNGTGANRTVRITPAANQVGQTTITLTVRDAGGLTATETFVVNVSAVNDAPVNSVPGTQSVGQNGSLQFSTAGSNLISIGDVDANSSNISVKLGVAHGTVTLATTAGLASVAGNGTAAINMSGPVSAINAALNGLTYAPVTNYVGTDTLSLTTDDLGNTGGGGPKTDIDAVTLNVVQTTAPTVAITDVSPDPRAGGVAEIVFVFSQAVTGFDLADLRLTRAASSTTSLLPGSATLTTTNNVTWRLGNMNTLTGPAGIYDLRLDATGSGIRSMEGANLLVGDTERWINGAGDSNEDRQFDQLDLIEVLQGGKYITGQPATWRQGDWNGDGVFNQVDIIAALAPGITWMVRLRPWPVRATVLRPHPRSLAQCPSCPHSCPWRRRPTPVQPMRFSRRSASRTPSPPASRRPR